MLDDPSGYGRITRENGNVTGIVEHKDASDVQRQIQEINTGILIANGADLKRWLSKLNNNNAQGEYYITDIIAMAYQEGHVEEVIAPIFYTVPLQLLAYHVALIKGTDVDQPRNLAKSVTVE